MKVLSPLLAVFLALTCFAVEVHAQTAPPMKKLRVTREAAVFLDSLATEARATNVENAGCAIAYSVRDSILTIEKFGPASYTKADSVAIYSEGPLCPHGVPVVHTHIDVEMTTDRPSDIDYGSRNRGGVWCLLVSVLSNGWVVRVF